MNRDIKTIAVAGGISSLNAEHLAILKEHNIEVLDAEQLPTAPTTSLDEVGRSVAYLDAATKDASIEAQKLAELVELTYIDRPGKNGLPAKKVVGERVEVRTDKKIGRNEICPCGSGMKYKKCCIKY